MTNQSPSLEEALAHYGVPGMKWGKHKAAPSSSSSGGSSSTSKSKAAPVNKSKVKGTPEHAARQAARKAMGKKVAVNVLASVGGVAVTAVAGSIAGSAVAGVLREVGAYHTTVVDHRMPLNQHPVNMTPAEFDKYWNGVINNS